MQIAIVEAYPREMGFQLLSEHWKLTSRCNMQLEEGKRGTSAVIPGCGNHRISFLPNWAPRLPSVLLHIVDTVDLLKHKSDHCVSA